VHPVLTVFIKEFRENLRERRTLFTALIVGPLLAPALFAGLLALQVHRGADGGARPVTLAVAHGERAPNLIAYLSQAGLSVTAVNLEGVAARQAVQTHHLLRLLEVDADFGSQLAAGRPAPLRLYVDSSDVSAGEDTARVRATLEQYSGELARLRLLARGIDPLLGSTLAVQDVDVSTPATRSVLVLGTLSYLLLLTMLMGGMYLAIDATAGERERGSLEPLLTLPVPRAQLIFGKILATCAYMLISLTLTVSAFAILLRFTGLERFGMSVTLGPWLALRLILCCLPLIPLAAALMTIVAAYTRTYREAQSYLGLVLLVPTLPLVFAGALGLRPTLALMAVPSLAQHFLIMSLLRDEPLPAAFVVVAVLSTTLLAVLLVAIAARLYRREALLG
jgi:sodium transport system permease protein